MILVEGEENPFVEMKDEKRNKNAIPVIENARIKMGCERFDLGFGSGRVLGLPIWEFL